MMSEGGDAYLRRLIGDVVPPRDMGDNSSYLRGLVREVSLQPNIANPVRVVQGDLPVVEMAEVIPLPQVKDIVERKVNIKRRVVLSSILLIGLGAVLGVNMYTKSITPECYNGIVSTVMEEVTPIDYDDAISVCENPVIIEQLMREKEEASFFYEQLGRYPLKPKINFIDRAKQDISERYRRILQFLGQVEEGTDSASVTSVQTQIKLEDDVVAQAVSPVISEKISSIEPQINTVQNQPYVEKTDDGGLIFTNQETQKNYDVQFEGEMVTPVEIIVHWDGNESPYKQDMLISTTLNGLINKKIPSSANFIIGVDGIFQATRMEEDKITSTLASTGHRQAINIEIAGVYFDTDPPTDGQFNDTVNVIIQMMNQYGLSIDDVKGHYETDKVVFEDGIAVPYDPSIHLEKDCVEFGKTDPGEIFMGRLIEGINRKLASSNAQGSVIDETGS